MTCALCSRSEEVSVYKMCGHCFHPACLQGWLDVIDTEVDKTVCPMCIAKDKTKHVAKKSAPVVEEPEEPPRVRQIEVHRPWKRYVLIIMLCVWSLTELGTARGWWILIAVAVLMEIFELRRIE